MQINKRKILFFSFIHPDHACLPRPIKAFCNTTAVLILLCPIFMACTSCVGILLSLASLQEAYPSLADGIASGAVGAIKGMDIGFTGFFLVVAFHERRQLVQSVRDHLYELIEEEIMPLHR